MLRPSWRSSFLGLVIQKLEFPDVKPLGSGSDASVSEVVWNGTPCAAKRLHDALLQDQSDDRVEKLIDNFEAECLTWSKLRHPGVVQFLGVYLDSRSRIPVLVMEKMDTSLREHLEGHTKEEFPLHQKAFVLRQVTQALAYLHTQNPSLVHHDLSTNNVLLNLVSLVTKISDFGMSRAINPSSLTRKSSIKGTLAFMAPEALHNPPRYNEKLDVFSFGNVILHTLTHEWPVPGSPPNRYEGGLGWFVGITEFNRREQSVELLTAQEKQLFFPVISRCLKNRPDKRTSSLELVQELIRIESCLPADDQLCQQLLKECRQKNEVIREKDKLIKEMDTNLKGKAAVISKLQLQLNAKEEEYKKRDEVISETFKAQKAEIQCLRDQLELHPKMMHPIRDWRQLGRCEKVIRHRPEGGRYGAVAVNSEGFLAVTDRENACVHLTRDGALVKSIGKGVLGADLCGVAFDLKGKVWVSDRDNNKVFKLSQNGRVLQTICHARSDNDHLRYPTGLSVSPEGLIYICDVFNSRVTVHDLDGKFLFTFGSHGSGPWYFDKPSDITFGADGLVYVADTDSMSVCVWSKEGMFVRRFKVKYAPYGIAAASENHLVISSYCSNTVMVYTLDGEHVHEFGEKGSEPGMFNGPLGICVNVSGVICVADFVNKRVQVF